MNDRYHLLWLLLPAGLVDSLRHAASQPLSLWDYLVNGGFITVALVLWVALRR